MLTHALDGPRRWAWLWPLEAPTPELLADLVAHGVTGVVPQQGAAAIAWATRHAGTLRAAGLDTCVGLGRVSTDAILRALDVPGVPGVMLDQEDWESVPDSDAVVRAVLDARPDAPQRVADCFYPCADHTEGGAYTGHGRIARAWAPLCGMRANQCYFARPKGHPEAIAPLGFVRRRLAWSREQYATIDPGDPIRLSCQLYARTVADHVATLFAERDGAVFLWHWRGADAAARAALRVMARPPVTLAGLSEVERAGLSEVERAAAVAWGQAALNDRAAPADPELGRPADPVLVVDGEWGVRSAARCYVYQDRAGLTPSGVLDAATLARLQRDVSGSCDCPH